MYNASSMPTPAVHLALAQKMLRREDLSAVVVEHLMEHRGAFLLGHTGPDVRSVSGQDREASHFYTVPRSSNRPARERLLSSHPSLARRDALTQPQIAFVAGYLAHLELDELWLDEVFQVFVRGSWASLRRRLFLHNVLRTWLDYQAQENLGRNVAQALQSVQPAGWLEFVRDADLREWRDWLVRQLAPGRRMETAEVFGERMGIPASEIDAVAQSPERMEESVFRHYPATALTSFQETGYERSVSLVQAYVSSLTCPEVGVDCSDTVRTVQSTI